MAAPTEDPATAMAAPSRAAQEALLPLADVAAAATVAGWAAAGGPVSTTTSTTNDASASSTSAATSRASADRLPVRTAARVARAATATTGSATIQTFMGASRH